ncbi:MAG TPA: ribonuclease III [Anaerolineaceae bacterium]|nr:ribonuclease III [Anaerolineaceae bacterium]
MEENNPLVGSGAANGRRLTPHELAANAGLVFRDWLLLSRALTHRSFLNEHPEALENNERLEFLGDAVLDFLVGAWLYNNYPEMPEGDLTRMRSALVHTEQLAEFGRMLHLGDAIRLGRGETQTGGRERSALLCDAFEALVGALYLDQGMEAVNKFIFPLLREASEDILMNRKTEDPKSRLQEWAQSEGYGAPIYVTRSSSGPEHSKTFEVDVMINNEVYGSGNGTSKQAATKEAARDALSRLGMALP